MKKQQMSSHVELCDECHELPYAHRPRCRVGKRNPKSTKSIPAAHHPECPSPEGAYCGGRRCKTEAGRVRIRNDMRPRRMYSDAVYMIDLASGLVYDIGS